MITVSIIEDEREIREGLSVLINGTTGYRCNNSFRSVEDAVHRIDSNLPMVVLVDIGLPGLSGIEGIRILKDKYPGLFLIALTIYDDNERIFNALCAGATGYLLKDTPPSRLLESISEVVGGGAPMSPEVALRVVELFRRFQPPPQADYRLTPHETELLKMLVEGHNYKTAAFELNISISTVSFHLQNVYRKLQVHSKSEAVAKALRTGLV